MPSAKISSSSSSSISLAGTPYAALTKRIPSTVNNTLVFELLDANCAIANAIRRTLVSELPVKHLTVALTDIKTTDPYVIGEVIRKRIEMIPVAQSIDPETVFSLRVENDSDTYSDVMSDEIKVNGVAASKDITASIPVCDINSNTSFSVNDIHVVESFGFDNSRVSIGRVGYEILNQDFTQSSQMAAPAQFRIELETPGIISPKEMVLKAIEGLIERLDAIDYANAIVEFDVYKLTIMNETHSIGRIMSWYIYQVMPAVKYVASRVPHPSKRECIIDVHHPNGEDLCKQAVEKAKADLKSLIKTFQ